MISSRQRSWSTGTHVDVSHFGGYCHLDTFELSGKPLNAFTVFRRRCNIDKVLLPECSLVELVLHLLFFSNADCPRDPLSKVSA